MEKLRTNARTTEVDDTSDRLLVLYHGESTLAEDTYLKPVFTKMQTISNQITEAVKRDRVISEMDDLDVEVEKRFRALAAVLKGYRAMPLEPYYTAGKALYAVQQKYKSKLLRLSYADQSSNIEALLMDLAAPTLKPHIEALPGVAEAIAHLRTAQTNFTGKRVAYEKAVAANAVIDPAYKLKQPLLEIINDELLPFLTAMRLVDAAKYGHFSDAVAQIIADTNQTIRRRAKKTDDKQPEENAE